MTGSGQVEGVTAATSPATSNCLNDHDSRVRADAFMVHPRGRHWLEGGCLYIPCVKEFHIKEGVPQLPPAPQFQKWKHPKEILESMLRGNPVSQKSKVGNSHPDGNPRTNLTIQRDTLSERGMPWPKEDWAYQGKSGWCCLRGDHHIGRAAGQPRA